MQQALTGWQSPFFFSWKNLESPGFSFYSNLPSSPPCKPHTRTHTQPNSPLPKIPFLLPTHENVDLFTNCLALCGAGCKVQKGLKADSASSREGKVTGDLRSRSEGARAWMRVTAGFTLGLRFCDLSGSAAQSGVQGPAAPASGIAGVLLDSQAPPRPTDSKSAF